MIILLLTNMDDPAMEIKIRKRYPLFLLLGFLSGVLRADPVYENDFSTAPRIEDAGRKTSPWINRDIPMPASGDSTFIGSRYMGVTHDGSELAFSGGKTGWLLINTETWSAGDYTVTFDGKVTSGTMYWDVIGGNGSGNLSVRLWTQMTRPKIRGTNAGTAERLGKTIRRGDTAGTPTEEVAAGSFSNTRMASQRLHITLTDSQVGSTNDYLLIGWGGASGSIDNLVIETAATQRNVPTLP